MADHSCNGCDARWGGANTCHCGGCHKTFTGLTAFDKHRSRYKCLDPQDAGLALSDRAYPCWGSPQEKPSLWEDEE